MNPFHSNCSWFCVRTRSKQEHIAASWIERYFGIEVYLPRIRFRRPLRRGPVWFTEALFPNYLFARFELSAWVHRVGCAPGVLNVVRFGNHWPIVPDETIETLRSQAGSTEVHLIDEQMLPGEPVKVAGGAFDGLLAVVARYMGERQRVLVLLEFLGRQTTVELPVASVAPVGDVRCKVLMS